MTTLPEKLVSGGQSGVDRAALDVAIEYGIACSGWCPRGRKAEDGPIPDRYPLQETESADYSQRTELNIRDSHGTLILKSGKLSGGTLLTANLADRLCKPCLIIDLTEPPDSKAVWNWLTQNHIRVLNVAGPRESQRPGIHDQAQGFLRKVLLPSLPLTE